MFFIKGEKLCVVQLEPPLNANRDALDFEHLSQRKQTRDNIRFGI
jgi:hypothetical protein